METSGQDLDLAYLEKGLPGISPALGAVHEEACIVCFHERSHSSGIEMKVSGTYTSCCRIWWTRNLTEQILRSYQDERETTELAACGLAFLLILHYTEYTVIERSWRGTGFDYWLAKRTEQDEETLPFLRSARLEVSGIRVAERESQIKNRVNEKISQTHVSDNMGLPAYIVVVEFARPEARVVTK